MEVNGHCDERFAAVRDEFERNFTERGDVGASFAASIEGEMVIDIWGGHRDGEKSLPPGRKIQSLTSSRQPKQ